MSLSMDPTARPRVLLIEDNPMQRDLYAMVLEERFEVVSAARADTGYDAACNQSPAVIVLDLLLPDGDGLRLSERLQANGGTSAIPIVVLTADDAAFARAKVTGSTF